MYLIESCRSGLLGVAIALASVACIARPAAAVTLPFTATLSIDVSGFSSGAISGSGIAVVNGSGSGGHVSALQLAAGFVSAAGVTTSITATSAAPIRGIQLTAANGAGAFAETSMGTLRGAMPLAGVAKVCLFEACPGAIANLLVPLSVAGSGGTAYASGAVNITVVGAPWTTGVAAHTLPYPPYISARTGFAHGPASGTSTTAQPGGSIQLVTPILISTSIPGDVPVVPGFATLTLHFVPEPTTAVLLGSTIALLAVGARRTR